MSLVYELERGWSFDGYYIPHLLELNWYFGESPFTYDTIQKIRVHGLTKGRALLNVAVAGMQTEYDSDYNEPQVLDLPYHPTTIKDDFVPTTNYTETSNRGISLQMKFQGRNTDMLKPEPPHVLQVLALQTSPQGNGRTTN